jgi:Putative prokaryotic signal transducing protein
MDIIYTAANSIEAHMIKGMLEQHNIPAYIQGEHLQNNVGGLLSMSGFVKISVDNENISTAKSIIREWELAEKLNIVDTNSSDKAEIAGANRHLLSIITSILIGATCMYFYLKPNINQQVIDVNKDGVDDEKWTYEDNVVVKYEHDRNLDGKFDDIWFYKNGLSSLHKLDNNYDGIFDTEDHFENGNIYYSKSDLNFDGEIDNVIDYESDQNYKTSMFSYKNRLLKKIKFYKNDYLKAAELDTNDDGKMDVAIEYDTFEEEISRKLITSK